MADRSKIVIPVEPETPHFDAEETLLSARPVVPITHEESAPVFNRPEAGKRDPFYRRSLFLSLVVIAAVGIGLAAGLAIARYRYVQSSASPVVAQPAQAPAPGDTRPTTAAASQTPEQAQAPALPEIKVEEKSAADDASTGDEAKTDRPGASTKTDESTADKSTGGKEENVRTNAPAPVTRDKKRPGDDTAEEAQDIPRAQRRERRQRESEEAVDIPRRIERASEQINRIREIFEGRPQRP